MNTRIFILLLVYMMINPVYSQNLLPDGSFELINNSGCISPEQGFINTVEWYAIQGNPDLFTNNCSSTGMDEIFWTENSRAYEGNNFIGLRCRVNSNQSYSSEGIATVLVSNLVEGQAYYLSLRMRNKGIYQGFPASVISCPLKPEKQIEIYTHNSTIEIDNDFSNGSATCNGDLVTSVKSSRIQSDQDTDEWFSAGACFIANNNVSNLAIIMPLGNFGTFPACAANDTKGTFFSYYFEFDDLILDILPTEIQLTKYIKKGESFEIYLPDEIDLPFIPESVIKWSDGFEGSRRELDKAGIYKIDLVLNCGVIPIILNLLPLVDEFPFFIPNVFSPNQDGINDVFDIFIPGEKEIIDFRLEVFDRWGNKVYESNDSKLFWNGEFNGSMVNGQFLYHLTCTLQDDTGKQNYSKTASITLLK